MRHIVTAMRSDAGAAATVVEGEVRHLTASGVCTYNGVTITPGDSISTIQTAIRASGVDGDEDVNVDPDGTSSDGALGENLALSSTVVDQQNMVGYNGAGFGVLTDGATTDYIYNNSGDDGSFTFDLGSEMDVVLYRMNCGGGGVVSGTSVDVAISDTGDFSGKESSVTLPLTHNDNWNEVGVTVNGRYVKVTVPQDPPI